MKNKLFLVILMLFLALGISISVNAEEEVSVYNKNEEVALNYEPILCDGEYYIHLDDLALLGLDVEKEDSKYTVSLNDCLGYVKKMTLTPTQTNIGGRIEIAPGIFVVVGESSDDIERISANVKRVVRPASIIGKSYNDDFPSGKDLIVDSFPDIVTTPLIGDVVTSAPAESITKIPIEELDFPAIYDPAFKNTGLFNQVYEMIKTDGEVYVLAKLIGETFSKSYSSESGRCDFFIDRIENVVTDVTINLVRGPVTVESGHNVNVYTAYKTGEGNTIDDFEILSSVSSVIPENESTISLKIETPAEKIRDKNIYFIADLGERYELICLEYDFSQVGKVLVNGNQKDVTYTINVNLPEADEKDVPFEITIYADGEEFIRQGTINSGEISATIEFTHIPPSREYGIEIEFGYHKYKNKYVEKHPVEPEIVRDFKLNHTAEYSKEVSATISLPDDYVCEENVEVELILGRYLIKNGIYVVNPLTDWSDSKIITLNNENRSQEVKLYTQESTAMLGYKLNGVYEGLCSKAYFGTSGKATSDIERSKKITENSTASMTLLRRKNIPVRVWRPYSLSTDNEVFARVQIYDFSDKSLALEFDYTQTPLIPKGERGSEFEFEIAEDKAYYLKIVDISGDSRLFNYFYYGYFSNLDTSSLRIISFLNDRESLDLLKCNNVKGTVLSEDDNINLTAVAICELYNGNIIECEAEVVDGKFDLKIPEDADRYKLAVKSKVGTNSYYVSNGISTNIDADATKVPYDFEYKGDKEVIIKYIVQKLSIPFEIAWSNYYDCFEYKNVSDYPVENFDVYVAYYGDDGRLILFEKNSQIKIASTEKAKQYINGNNSHRIKKIKCFIWKNGEITPLSNTCSVKANMPHIPDNDLSVFTMGEKSAIINCKEERLSQAPCLTDGDLYIASADFEKLGYEIEEDGEWVYIKGEWDSYEIPVEENRAYLPDDDDFYEISAPIIYDDDYELLFPVIAISELFGENTEWHTDGEILVVNRPFPDIDYTDVYIEAIYSMHYRGVLSGDEYGVYHPDLPLRRSEAAACFTRFMGYQFDNYTFECEDMTSDHWATPYIKIVIEEGLFELEDGCFRPDDYITVEESVIAALKMMGKYSEKYMDAARENGLLKNISEENIKRNITRVEFIQLLYNTEI